MSYSILTNQPLRGTDDGCPGQWYLIDKHDNPSCADSCPTGWVQQIDTDLDVKWCKQPVDAADLPTIDQAADQYEASKAGMGIALGAVGVLALAGAGVWYATRRKRRTGV